MNLAHPSEFIREELQARNWTQGDLAKVLNRPLAHVNMLCKGRRGITARTAKELSAAFGTSAELWMNLWSSYRLSKIPPTRAKS